MKPAGALLLLLSWAVGCFAQDVLRLGPEDEPGRAGLAEVAWLAGHWTGTGLGGDCDEAWLPPADGTMPGVFRLVRDGTVAFSEFMVLEEREGSLVLRVKHFNRDLTPWEEKDRWVEFPLVKAEGQTAWFHGLTYRRDGDELVVHLALRTRDGERIETFRLRRLPLPLP